MGTKKSKWKKVILLFPVLLSFIFGAAGCHSKQEELKLRHNFANEYNQRLAKIPEEQRAWPIYRKALLRLHDWKRVPEEFVGLSDRQLEELRDRLKTHRDAISQIYHAASREHLAFPLTDGISEADSKLQPFPITVKSSPNPRLMALNLIAPQSLDRASRFVLADAAVALADGDGERFVEAVSTLLRIAEHINESGFLVTENLGRSVASQTVDLTLEILQAPKVRMDRASLEKLSKLFADFAAGNDRIKLEGSHLVFRDIVQRHYTDDGKGSGLFRDPKTGKTNRFAASRKEIRSAGEKLYQDAEKELMKPARDLKAFQTLRELKRLSQDNRFVLLQSTFPDVFTAYCRKEILQLRISAIRVAIALELYFHDNGKWPDDLSQLKAGYLKHPPLDRFRAEPLGYRLDGEFPALYSVGPDGDQDSRGRETRRTSSWVRSWHSSIMSQTEPKNGDWLLWKKDHQ